MPRSRATWLGAIGTTLLIPLVVSLATPAWATPPSGADSFGQHVRDCAHQVGFNGQHNPGMHHGAAGWDGLPCLP